MNSRFSENLMPITFCKKGSHFTQRWSNQALLNNERKVDVRANGARCLREYKKQKSKLQFVLQSQAQSE